jgi:hypothetical protein
MADAADPPNGRGEGVTAHDLADLVEVVWSEDAGRHDGQEVGVAAVAVLKGVDGSAGDEDDLARCSSRSSPSKPS